MRDHARDKIYLKIRPAIDVSYPRWVGTKTDARARLRAMLRQLPSSARLCFDLRDKAIRDLPGRDWHNFSALVVSYPADFYIDRRHLDGVWESEHDSLLGLGRKIRRADPLAKTRPCPWVDYQEEAWRPGWMTSFLLEAIQGRKLRLNKLEPLTQRLGMDMPLHEREKAGV